MRVLECNRWRDLRITGGKRADCGCFSLCKLILLWVLSPPVTRKSFPLCHHLGFSSSINASHGIYFCVTSKWCCLKPKEYSFAQPLTFSLRTEKEMQVRKKKLDICTQISTESNLSSRSCYMLMHFLTGSQKVNCFSYQKHNTTCTGTICDQVKENKMRGLKWHKNTASVYTYSTTWNMHTLNKQKRSEVGTRSLSITNELNTSETGLRWLQPLWYHWQAHNNSYLIHRYHTSAS